MAFSSQGSLRGGKKVFKTAGPEQSPTAQRRNHFQAAVLLAAFIVTIIYTLHEETVCIQKKSKIINKKKAKNPNSLCSCMQIQEFANIKHQFKVALTPRV